VCQECLATCTDKPRGNLTKVKTCCYNCGSPICMGHLVKFCYYCCGYLFKAGLGTDDVMMYTSVESLVLRIICNRVKYCRIAAS
jgi:hypothetical protein